MRKLKIGIVILVVIGFPLVSWIYLRSGLNWRLAAQEETAVKGTLEGFELLDDTGRILSPETLKGTFYLWTKVAHPDLRDEIESVHDQFAVRKDYKTICLLGALDQAWRKSDEHWVNATCQSGCDQLMEILFQDNHDAALVDNTLAVRGRYRCGNTDEIRNLIRHTAVILPIEKREKLELKRGDQPE